jgi:hypothetical protein
MYPAPFKYHARIPWKRHWVASGIGDGAALGGGQSSCLLKLRFDEPTDLVDIGRIPGSIRSIQRPAMPALERSQRAARQFQRWRQVPIVAMRQWHCG